MRNQAYQRAANWAIQDGEILPSKLKREKAEITQQVSNDTEIRFGSGRGIAAQNICITRAVTMQSDNHTGLGIGNAAAHKFKENGLAHAGVSHVRKCGSGQSRLALRIMTSH